MKRNLTNHECVGYMAKRQDFSNKQGSIYGNDVKWYGDPYNNGIVVTFTCYSYGTHFPMYVYDYQTKEWYGNCDKASRTTSKHQSLMRPPVVHQWFDTKTLQMISSRGLVRTLERRLAA